MTTALDRLRRVTRADVYKASTLAGHLTRDTQGTVTFHYTQGYCAAPVASTLPVDGRPVVAPGGGLPPFFSGLLPEGHRLTVLRTATKTSADDELTLLLAVGADAPGDVQIVPAGETPHEAPALAAATPGALDFAAIADIPDRRALPGVQAKASASMVNVPLALHGRSAILKLDPPEHPHLVVNEALHLEGARRLGIPVSEHDVVTDRHGRPGLLVRRFDRVDVDDGAPARLALEDGAQALGIYPAQKYAVTTEEVITALTALTPAAPVAARNLYLQFLYAWLTGDGDLHAKNVSVLQGTDGRWQVAPMYDVPCTVLYRDMTMALTVDGRDRTLRRRHWEALADAIGLPQRAAEAAMRKALAAAEAVDLRRLPFEGSPLKGAERELRYRRGELRG
ncbi:type II toxin-antitoxin system HipA family toxin [Micrococcus sp.]|uniref:type II toxin-antitoxin system HipA family toxin n=1 Tax=Micrococcus sp. TaxID=1271 RepID=UPI002A912F41|nr:HipA domain-containing protein [Micrococcus sp.]MDY6054760.1 HipA domain-containing protein [Micrococcus sp.]